MDEYVQNTYIDLAPDRTTLEVNLTPGVLVAPEVVALIDADGDGEFSEAEGAGQHSTEATTNKRSRG